MLTCVARLMAGPAGSVTKRQQAERSVGASANSENAVMRRQHTRSGRARRRIRDPRRVLSPNVAVGAGGRMVASFRVLQIHVVALEAEHGIQRDDLFNGHVAVRLLCGGPYRPRRDRRRHACPTTLRIAIEPGMARS